MARPQKATQGKRLRELAKKEKKQDKLERRALRKAEKESRPVRSGDEDPDLAGIVPGPQPPLDF